MALRSKWRPRRAKILFVTGGSGFLGRHLVNGLASADWEIVAPSSTSLDIRNREAVIDAVRDWRPTAIAHLAYRKPDRRSIVDGSRHIAEAASLAKSRLVHMSSDVIFPGRPRPYVETDEPFGLSDYARDKIDAERGVAAACPGAVMIRTSLIYGTIELAPLQQDVVDAIEGRRPTTFFTDQVRCPVHVDDVAVAVSRLAAMPGVGGPLHVAGPDALSRAEFAARTARLLGLDPTRIRTTTMAEAGLVLPGRVVLDSSRAAALGIACRPVY
ncbi:MAG: SDR family oxidoreductase [Ilumatobacteraceae bacterium]